MTRFAVAAGTSSETVYNLQDAVPARGERSPLGDHIHRAFNSRIPVDVRYGTETLTLDRAFFSRLDAVHAPPDVTEQRIAMIEHELTSRGVPNARDNAIRVLDAIQRWNVPRSRSGESRGAIVIDAGARAVSVVYPAAAAPQPGSVPRTVTQSPQAPLGVGASMPQPGGGVRASTPPQQPRTLPMASDHVFAQRLNYMVDGGRISISGYRGAEIEIDFRNDASARSFFAGVTTTAQFRERLNAWLQQNGQSALPSDQMDRVVSALGTGSSLATPGPGWSATVQLADRHGVVGGSSVPARVEILADITPGAM